MLRFHDKTGGNITFEEQGKIACSSRYAYNPLLFGNRPLAANERFLFETLSDDSKWASYLRCGVTLHNPKTTDLKKIFVPSLINLDKSWVFTVFPYVAGPLGRYEIYKESNSIHSGLLTGSQIAGCISKHQVALHISSMGGLYINVDGVQYGPLANNIPVGLKDIYVVVYGTQKMRIIDEWGRYQLVKYSVL